MTSPSPALIDLLRCPRSLQPLRLASAEELARLAGAPEGALIREDGTLAYPIRDGIPVVLSEEAMALELPVG